MHREINSRWSWTISEKLAQISSIILTIFSQDVDQSVGIKKERKKRYLDDRWRGLASGKWERIGPRGGIKKFLRGWFCMGKTVRIDETSINGYQAEEYAWESNLENEFLDLPDNAAKTLYRFVVGMSAVSFLFQPRGRTARGGGGGEG